jgi:hypothetical protein
MWPTSVKKGVVDVAESGDGFILVGATRKPLASKVWTSADGLSWERAKDDTFDGAAMVRVEAFDGGIVALGQKGRRLVAWHSTDGSSWKRTTIDKAGDGLSLVPYGLTAGPDGLLAVVSVIGQDIGGQRFYYSPDGREWSVVDPPSADTGGIFTALEGTADEFLAVARPAFSESTNLYWRAPGDLSWESFEGPADGLIHDLATGSDGSFVAVGGIQETDTYRPAIWHATELGEWDLVYTAPSAKETEDRLDVVARGGPGFVAAGTISACPQQEQRYCPTASILVSEDGREWRSLGIVDGVPGPLQETEISSLASDGATTVLVAAHTGRPSEIWTLPATTD